MFLDSLCSPEGKFPERLEEEVLRPALVARFRVARLHSRFISTSPTVQLDNLNKSLENYKYEYSPSTLAVRYKNSWQDFKIAQNIE